MARKKQSEPNRQHGLLPVRHRSLQPKSLNKKRLTDSLNPQRLYAAMWKRFTRERAHLLPAILDPDSGPIPVITQRDAEVVASVIQWLGTNVGGAFLIETERRLYEARAKMSKTRYTLYELERDRINERQAQLDRDKLRLDTDTRFIDLSGE